MVSAVQAFDCFTQCVFAWRYLNTSPRTADVTAVVPSKSTALGDRVDARVELEEQVVVRRRHGRECRAGAVGPRMPVVSALLSEARSGQRSACPPNRRATETTPSVCSRFPAHRAEDERRACRVALHALRRGDRRPGVSVNAGEGGRAAGRVDRLPGRRGRIVLRDLVVAGRVGSSRFCTVPAITWSWSCRDAKAELPGVPVPMPTVAGCKPCRTSWRASAKTRRRAGRWSSSGCRCRAGRRAPARSRRSPAPTTPRLQGWSAPRRSSESAWMTYHADATRCVSLIRFSSRSIRCRLPAPLMLTLSMTLESVPRFEGASKTIRSPFVTVPVTENAMTPADGSYVWEEPSR